MAEIIRSAYVVPFSHLDLFWGGSREECLSRGNFIIKRALDLLEKHQDFRFLLETMNFVENYLSCHPEDKERFSRLVAEGRLELGPLWSGIYQNLPGGETLARNALYAKQYARKEFGADPVVAHFADLPGYTPQYPQIAEKSGIKYLLMSRGGPSSTPLFKWRASDGTEILSYYVIRGYAGYCRSSNSDYKWHSDYSHMVGDGYLENALNEDSREKDYSLLVHWGMDLYAPSENIILNVRKWNNEKPRKLQFATLTEFFNNANQTKNTPSLEGEVPSSWPNIESSWPDIWPEDFPCEAAMHMAEFLSAYCLIRGWNDYPSAQLEQAWKSLLDGMDHNQNGQGGIVADKDKLQLKVKARYQAEEIINKMAWRLAAKVKSPSNDAFPVVVLNSMSWKRSGVVLGRATPYGEIDTTEYPGRCKDYKLINSQGEEIPYVQINRYNGASMSTTIEMAFPAKDVPALGYQTYYLVPGKNTCNQSLTCSNISLDVENDYKEPRRNPVSNTYQNKFFKLEVDVITGEVTITDLKNGEPVFTKAAIVGVEERRGNYIWSMHPSGRTFPALLEGIQVIDNNAVWCRIQIKGSVYGVSFAQTYTLYHDFPDILLENEIDWKEPRWVRIQQIFPYTNTQSTVKYAVPFGQVSYPETLSELEQTQTASDEIPVEFRRSLRLARQWVDVGTAANGVTIGANHRMWEFDKGILRSYMVRGCTCTGAVTQDDEGRQFNIERPPAGKYKVRYLIRPRNGSLAETASYRCGWELNHPTHQVTSSNPNLDESAMSSESLCDFTNASVVVTAFKKAESGSSVVMRAFEATGQGVEVNTPSIKSKVAAETNILEETRERSDSLKTKFKPFEIKTLIFDDLKS